MTILDTLMSILGTLTPVSMIVCLIVLGSLSQRLGSITRAGKRHRWFYVAASCLAVSFFISVLHVSVDAQQAPGLLSDPDFYAIGYGLPMAVGLTIGSVVAWSYWDWLLLGEGPR